nr:restriction endonuclease [Prolixibacteraceae bacterium]
GRDYELYCGWKYEKNDWEVSYIGMEKKLNDMGRDLIALKNMTHHIIQCKYWSKKKTIHEKHITQLFGTSVEYELQQPKGVKVVPVFITSTKLSETAKVFAERLGVVVKENIPLLDFPRIKCNVNQGFSKIYHLPFDQQYDRTKINKKDEIYAYTVKEASNAGFRRAFKYFG